MANFLTNLGLLASQNPFLAYFIIYVITIFLGNISAFAGFWLVFRSNFGALGVPLLILTIFCANVSGDLLWYSLGRALRETRLGNFVKNRLPGHAKIENNLQKNGPGWIFVSKFLYGSSMPIIFSIGWTRIDFKKFFRVSLLSILVWLPILSGLAYGLILGLMPLGAVAIFKNFEVAFFLGLGIFLLLDYFLAKLFRTLVGKKLFGAENNGLESGQSNTEERA